VHFAACTIPLGTFELYAPGCEKKSVYKGQTMTREQYHVQINLFFLHVHVQINRIFTCIDDEDTKYQ